MEGPLVSVIIPAYKAAPYIKECVESVLKQSYRSFEIIVVDDGSPDNQKDILEPYLVENENIHYYYQQNKGVAAARNKGFDYSKGTLISFLDADDVWMSDNLALKVSKILNSEYGLVHSGAFFINEYSSLLEGHLSGEEGNLLNAMLAWEKTQIPGPSSVLLKREVIEEVGFWDESLSTSADQDFFIRVANKYKIGKVEKFSWKYRIHGQNMHKNIEVMERDVLRTFQKAKLNNLFYSKPFEKKCFANMYSILGASWAGDGGDFFRGGLFFLRAIERDPLVMAKLVRKIISRFA